MLIYLHGFNSSPASHKAQVMKAHLEGRGLAQLYACPALPDTPGEAIGAIEAAIAASPAHRDPRTVTFLGSSLGGYYATYLAEKLDCRAVLVNPAITPHVGLAAYLGMQTNLHTGLRYELTQAHLDGWRELLVERVDPERYLLLLETGDEVLDWRQAARKYEGARMVIRQGGDHTLQSFPEHLGRILAFAGIRAGR
ncbi:MAG TPA: YqiA/YcfP family alpha/beta fold hydrolase [Burkholderiales bacterium]|nr:YqiA/YcfP family alpha/beta fold hydrolase [Burkholderiales bacterium]